MTINCPNFTINKISLDVVNKQRTFRDALINRSVYAFLFFPSRVPTLLVFAFSNKSNLIASAQRRMNLNYASIL